MHSSPDKPRLSGLARVAIAGLIWGSIPLALAAAHAAPVVKVFLRVVSAGIVIVAYQALTSGFGDFVGLPAAKWRQLIVQSLILTFNWFLFFTALDLTSVATAELLGYTGPVFVAALGPAVTGERFDRRIVGPLLLALGGIAVIVVPQGLSLGSRRELMGAIVAFASALTYATLLLRSKKILRGVSSATLMTVEYTVASIVLIPFAVVSYFRGGWPSDAGSYLALVVLGVFHSAFAGLVFLSGLRQVRTDRVAVLTYVEPVSAVVFAAMFMGQPLTATTIAGGTMVVLGGLIVARLDTSAIASLPLEVTAPDGDGGSEDSTRG